MSSRLCQDELRVNHDLRSRQHGCLLGSELACSIAGRRAPGAGGDAVATLWRGGVAGRWLTCAGLRCPVSSPPRQQLALGRGQGLCEPHNQRRRAGPEADSHRCIPRLLQHPPVPGASSPSPTPGASTPARGSRRAGRMASRAGNGRTACPAELTQGTELAHGRSMINNVLGRKLPPSNPPAQNCPRRGTRSRTRTPADEPLITSAWEVACYVSICHVRKSPTRALGGRFFRSACCPTTHD